ncbi:hypothetical protein TNCV_5126811 [Trichonephila clavipes]|nr:hypothetical protein TNCV_5126811 [Trichonephila clavipes]
MPPFSRSQNEAHEIHRGKELEERLSLKLTLSTIQVQNVKLGGHQTCLSINRLWHELCDMLRRLLEPQLLDIMIVQFRNEKFNNHGSIPITIDCNVVAFIVFKKDSTSPKDQFFWM